MAVRFDAAARRAIDQAMTEVENRGHASLDSVHLLIGLAHSPDTAVARAAAALGVTHDKLKQESLALLSSTKGSGAMAAIEVAGRTEEILQRASAISIERSADVVTDLDILIALAERDDTAASRSVRKLGLTAERLNGVRATATVGGASGTAGRPAARPSGEIRAMNQAGATQTRVGIGYDSHRFADGGPLVLGGIRIPHTAHLAGHSDGDAVAHALTDAVLGAAALGDIGEMFSDTDPANKGRNSIDMLAAAVARVRKAGWQVQQVDVAIVAEAPRIIEHRSAMAAALAGALGVDPSAISIKGKTNEGMGWVGRGEGIACIAVATITSAVGSA